MCRVRCEPLPSAPYQFFGVHEFSDDSDDDDISIGGESSEMPPSDYGDETRTIDFDDYDATVDDDEMLVDDDDDDEVTTDEDELSWLSMDSSVYAASFSPLSSSEAGSFYDTSLQSTSSAAVATTASMADTTQSSSSSNSSDQLSTEDIYSTTTETDEDADAAEPSVPTSPCSTAASSISLSFAEDDRDAFDFDVELLGDESIANFIEADLPKYDYADDNIAASATASVAVVPESDQLWPTFADEPHVYYYVCPACSEVYAEDVGHAVCSTEGAAAAAADCGLSCYYAPAGYELYGDLLGVDDDDDGDLMMQQDVTMYEEQEYLDVTEYDDDYDY